MAGGARNEVSALSPLARVCEEGEKGFRDAADRAKGELRKLFLEYAEQRARMAGELRERLGGETLGGSLLHAIHRGWVQAKSAAGPHGDAALIAECERAEDAAVRAYEEALSRQGLSPDIRAMIERHYAQIKVAHDRIRDMEKAGRVQTQPIPDLRRAV